MGRFGVILMTKENIRSHHAFTVWHLPIEKVKFLLRVMQLMMVKKDQTLAWAILPQELP